MPESHADKGRMFRSSSFEGLCKAIKLFRIEAALPMGDVEHEVATYIREKSPESDRNPGRVFEPRPEGRPGYNPPIERAKIWLVGMGRRKLRRVMPFEAEPRAEACRECPHNVKWKTSCVPCNEDVEYRGINLRSLPKWDHDEGLRFCRLHDLYLPAAVFLDREHLHEAHSDAPASCWLKPDTLEQSDPSPQG